MKVIDLTGQKFGKLTVIKQVGKKDSRIVWLCRCDCGNEKIVKGIDLKREHVKSCGCFKKENPSFKTHGKRCTRIYPIWNLMKQRCFNPKNKSYIHYGGRGIAVCDEWKNSFEKFYKWAIANGYKEELNKNECTLDRINVDGNYEPNNCRWITNKEQQRNRRNNHLITYKGETHTISQWEEKSGVDNGLLFQRLRLGWEINRAIETPIRERKIKYTFIAKGDLTQLKALKEYLIKNKLI